MGVETRANSLRFRESFGHQAYFASFLLNSFQPLRVVE